MKKDSLLNHRFKLLLMPSWLSGLICITTAAIVSIAGVIVADLKSGRLRQDVFIAHSALNEFNTGYQTVANNLDRYQIVGELILFVFWIGVGLIACFFMFNIVRGWVDAVRIERGLHYANTNPRSVLAQASLNLLIRLVAIGLWLLIVDFTFHKILPYDLTAARAIVMHISVQTSLELLAGTALLWLTLTVQVICLRLLFLRPRLFGYMDS